LPPSRPGALHRQACRPLPGWSPGRGPEPGSGEAASAPGGSDGPGLRWRLSVGLFPIALPSGALAAPHVRFVSVSRALDRSGGPRKGVAIMEQLYPVLLAALAVL